MRRALKPVDLLSIIFIALLAMIALFFLPAISYALPFIIRYVLYIFLILSVSALDGRWPEFRFITILHTFIPILIVLLVFNSLGDLIPGVRRHYFDDALIRIDHAIFGFHPTIWMERFNNALLTGLLQIAYISYYFMPISLATVLFVKKKHEDFDSAVFAIVLCFYLSYIGYLLVPAVGPRFTLDTLQTMDIKAGPLISWIRQGLDGLEQNKTDAFPSGHTAIALVSLFYSWKCREKVLIRILVPAVSALIVSTVYLRYHYVIDVIAGFILAILTVLIAPATFRLFSRSTDQRQNQLHHSS